MNDQLVVQHVLSETEFVAYHNELQTPMILKQIGSSEDLSNWIKLPTHSNVVNCFDTFHDRERHMQFSLAEVAKVSTGDTEVHDMYSFVRSMNLNLGIKIETSYMEMIYDCMIQLTLGMEHAHINGLVHGTFGLHSVVVSKDGDTSIYKMTNFTPGSSMRLPAEATFWPFARGRDRLLEAERIKDSEKSPHQK